MPLLQIPQSGLPLHSPQSAASPDFTPADVFGLTLSDSVIEDMIKCVRDGKSIIQLSLGRDPQLSYGTKIQHLSSSFDPFEHEFYRTVLPPHSAMTSNSSNMSARTSQGSPAMHWGKLLNKNFSPKGAPKNASKATGVARSTSNTKKPSTPASRTPDMSAVSGADAALAALKNSLATETARKKDNTTVYVKDTSSLPPAVQQKGSAQPTKAGSKTGFLSQNKKSLAGAMTRSTPTSPAPSGAGSPALAPTSVPVSQQLADKAKTIRKPIVHQLALGPATEANLFKYHDTDAPDQEFRLAIEKVAELEDGVWKLKQKAFKDLDVFSYKRYTLEMRQTAIDNAIRAYDKMRLNRSEPEWQRLLPYDERGQGKCLSKLQAQIATGTIHPPKINVQGAEDSGRDTPSKNNDKAKLLGDKSHIISKGGEAMARSNSQPPTVKSNKASEKEAQTKRLLAKPTKKPVAKTKVAEKKSVDKESSKIKSSKFVSDSDEEDQYPNPASSTLAAKPLARSTTSVKPAQKRVRDEVDDTISAKASKKQKNTSPQKSSPLASSPPTNASDISDSSLSSINTSRKRSSELSSDAAPEAKRHQKSSSISTTSSVASGLISPSRRVMIIEKSKRFKTYYQKYARLHEELSANSKREPDKLEELLEMHERLTKMKEEIIKEAEM